MRKPSLTKAERLAQQEAVLLARRERHRVKMQAKTEERVAAGLCVLCGKNPPAEGVQRCVPCSEHVSELRWGKPESEPAPDESS